MSAFVYEIAAIHEAVKRAFPASPKGVYAVPWYLVVGEPGSGRTAAVHAMQLTWTRGEEPLRTGLPQQLCTYWMPEEAVFIEPGGGLVGPRASLENLRALGEELNRARPREPVDGILLVLSIKDFIDLDEKGIEDYSNRLRKYLLELDKALGASVPVYTVLSRYDTLWGFAEVFQWGPDRAREEPWGFTLPASTDSQKAVPVLTKELDGLNARLESFCLAKLSGEDPPEVRVRAFQHLAEVRNLMEKLRLVFATLFMANAYERAPWIRAVAVGCAVPGQGERIRASVQRFSNMGLQQGHAALATQRPGGLPIHAFFRTVVLPERDLVPLRTRWWDDALFKLLLILGILLFVGAIGTTIAFAVIKGI